MAEQEVIKHTKNVLKIWSSKEHSIWHKVKEFLIEIFIIIFAVSISIWFHTQSEHHQEQEVAKRFLLGLKKDINEDIEDTKQIMNEFKTYDTVYTYFNSLDKNKKPNLDSINKMLHFLNENNFLRPHKSRFNGFLSAGKIMTIENDSLTINILDYYQERLSEVNTSENAWLSLHGALYNYILDNIKDGDVALVKWEILTTPKGKFLTKALIPWGQIYDRYNALITNGQIIIKQIDKMYPKE